MAGSTQHAQSSRFIDPIPPTAGIEEEFFVVDPRTRRVSPEAAGVVRQAGTWTGGSISTEFTKYQVETRTDPFTDLGDLAAEVVRMRDIAATAATGEGLRITATGTPVQGDIVPPPIADIPRYRETTAMYRTLQDGQSISACHVHVHMPDPELAVLVSNHLRPWLPVLLSMNANSPYWAGRDTGYASWRTLSWSGWPVAGPPPYFESRDHFDETVGTLVAGGALMDRRSIFWDIRPSAHLPTIEVRVADVAATSFEGPLFAALVRGLVALATQAVKRGDRGPRIAPELLRAASWRAARDGLEGKGIDTRTGKLREAGELVESLLAEVRPILRAWGEWDRVTGWWQRLRSHGSGATRQRAAYAKRGYLDDVVDCLIEQNQPGTVHMDRSAILNGPALLPVARNPFQVPEPWPN